MILCGVVVDAITGRGGLTFLAVVAPLALTVPLMVYYGISIDWDNLDEPNPPDDKKEAPKPTSAVG